VTSVGVRLRAAASASGHGGGGLGVGNSDENQWDLLAVGGLEGWVCGSDEELVGPSDGERPRGERACDSNRTF
jgi:hypothetical protein